MLIGVTGGGSACRHRNRRRGSGVSALSVLRLYPYYGYPYYGPYPFHYPPPRYYPPPATVYVRPARSTHNPSAGLRNPAPSYYPPGTTYAAPVPNGAQPAATYLQPAPSLSAPPESAVAGSVVIVLIRCRSDPTPVPNR